MKTRIYAAPAVKGLTLEPSAPIIFVFLIFYQRIACQLLSMLKIKRDINRQYLKIVDHRLVKSA